MEAHFEEERWRPLQLLEAQFRANCAALAHRDAGLAERLLAWAPAGECLLQTAPDHLRLARRKGESLEPIPNLISPAAARDVVKKVYPKGQCTEPIVVAGVDQGWLWQMLYGLPCAPPGLPGHRPPLFFLVRQIEELWLALHLHDWRKLLADNRVRLFFGEDSAQQLEHAFLDDGHLPWPRLSLTIDPQLWPAGTNLESILNACRAKLSNELQGVMNQLGSLYASPDPASLGQRFASGQPLRILGITSRYTTFLQYSMRDWLAAFEAMGHQTKLVIESADHETMTNLVYARTCAEFQPDLVVLIDHYRRELEGFPENVPCVMWIQDWLPNITTTKAGAAQTARDYVLGYGRIECTRQYGYPASRFLPAMVGVNEKRFGSELVGSASADRLFCCDVSFVSHASTPADVLVQRNLETAASDGTRRLIRDIFDRLLAIYDAGQAVSDPQHMTALVQQSLLDLRLTIVPEHRETLVNFFSHQVNNALFRHQTLNWLAELDLNIHLYGRGWETHPTLKRYARGPADNQTQLATIYRSSKINLHLTPHGAVHQRVLDGLCAGGFFLIRHRPGDAAGIAYRPLCRWIREQRITSDEELRAKATPQVREWIAAACAARDWNVFDLGYPFVDELNLLADSDYTLAGAALWEDYFQVAFASKTELHQKAERYLSDESERQRIVGRMVQPVLEKLTYQGINRRLLDFIAGDLSHQARKAA